MPENDQPGREGKLVLDRSAEHTLRNHLSVIHGFCDVMQSEIDPSHSLQEDLLEIRKAARAALAILNETRRV